jgi:hypothetical protein
MLKIIKITDPTGIDYLEEYLQTSDGETLDDILGQLKTAIVDLADQVYVIAGFDVPDEEGEPVIQAFLIAYSTLNTPVAFVSQVWACDKLIDETIPDRLFFRFICWAESLGCTRVLSDTDKGNKPFLEKWDFQHVSSTLKFNIPRDFDLTKIGGDDNANDGTRQPTSGSSEEDKCTGEPGGERSTEDIRVYSSDRGSDTGSDTTSTNACVSSPSEKGETV